MNKQTLSATTDALVTAPVYPILLMISLSHLLNDTIQSLIPSIYPMVKDSFHLNFSQIGLITFTFQLAASLLQPLVGLYTDKRPQPFSLVAGMGVSLAGLLLLARASSFEMVLVAVALIGIGSSIFHPEASKVAYMASGGKRGTAQSVFQVGGNAGSALGPLLAAMIIVPFGRGSLSWFSLLALAAMMVLFFVGRWYKVHRAVPKAARKPGDAAPIPRGKVILGVSVLLVLIFSKYFYLASITNYYTFFLIGKFHVSVQQSQYYLFLFLVSVAAGTLLGGPLGDRFGRKYIIWFSILGVAPFSLLLPFANLFWTGVLTVFIGVILSSAFPAILVFAQELLPGKIGMISGLFYGFAFGMGGLGSALLGTLADHTSIEHVYRICAYLPLIGLLTGLLPNIGGRKKMTKKDDG